MSQLHEPERTPLDGAALGVMVLLTALWGFQQVTVKWIAAECRSSMQAAIRSIIATVLLLAGRACAASRSSARRHGLAAGLAAGLLFAGEFVFIYGGPGPHQRLAHVGVHLSRAAAHRARPALLRPGRAPAACGSGSACCVAFAGSWLRSPRASAAAARPGSATCAAWPRRLLWAATTVADPRHAALARRAPPRRSSTSSGVSALALPLASMLLGEKGIVALTPLVAVEPRLPGRDRRVRELPRLVLAAHAATSRRALAVLSFLTPMFGVLCGVVFLREPLSGAVRGSPRCCVAAGIVLVNLRR